MILGFFQYYNESKKGNLRRFLNNMVQYCDELVAYDDGSTDDSYDICREYMPETNIIRSKENDFCNEIAHKQLLLELALSKKPRAIVWLDCDSILDSNATNGGVKELIESGQGDLYFLHLLNFWRSHCWYRVDNQYNDLNVPTIWMNNGGLKYNIEHGLHKPQMPSGFRKHVQVSQQILHFGFATVDRIIDKYLHYKEVGVTGWDLNRIIDESTLDLKQVDLNLYPESERPEAEECPTQIDYSELIKGRK